MSQTLILFQAIIQQFENLVKLCENIERDFFERLGSASEEDDNGAFVKLPWQWNPKEVAIKSHSFSRREPNIKQISEKTLMVL